MGVTLGEGVGIWPQPLNISGRVSNMVAARKRSFWFIAIFLSVIVKIVLEDILLTYAKYVPTSLWEPEAGDFLIKRAAAIICRSPFAFLI